MQKLPDLYIDTVPGGGAPAPGGHGHHADHPEQEAERQQLGLSFCGFHGFYYFKHIIRIRFITLFINHFVRTAISMVESASLGEVNILFKVRD